MTYFQGRIAAQGAFKNIIELNDKTSLTDSASPRKTKEERAVEEEPRMVMYNNVISTLENRRCKSLNKC